MMKCLASMLELLYSILYLDLLEIIICDSIYISMRHIALRRRSHMVGIGGVGWVLVHIRDDGFFIVFQICLIGDFISGWRKMRVESHRSSGHEKFMRYISLPIVSFCRVIPKVVRKDLIFKCFHYLHTQYVSRFWSILRVYFK
jgi:hypothetical protein